jgi:hypothetical protein
MDRKVDRGVLLLLFCFVISSLPSFSSSYSSSSSSSSCRRFDRRRARQALYSIGRPSDPTSRPARSRGKYGRMLSTTGQHRSDEYSIHSHRNDDDDDDDDDDDENGE